MAQEVVRRSLTRCLQRIMRRKQFQAVSVAEICELAGISRRSFYRYYHDKYELLQDVYHSLYFSRLKSDREWNTWDYHREICTQIYRDPDFFRHAAEVRGQNGFWQCCREELYPLVLQDLKNYNLTAESMEYFHILYEASADALITIMKNWLNSSPMTDPLEFSDSVRRAFFEHAVYQCKSTSSINNEDFVPDGDLWLD